MALLTRIVLVAVCVYAVHSWPTHHMMGQGMGMGMGRPMGMGIGMGGMGLGGMPMGIGMGVGMYPGMGMMGMMPGMMGYKEGEEPAKAAAETMNPAKEVLKNEGQKSWEDANKALNEQMSQIDEHVLDPQKVMTN